MVAQIIALVPRDSTQGAFSADYKKRMKKKRYLAPFPSRTRPYLMGATREKNSPSLDRLVPIMWVAGNTSPRDRAHKKIEIPFTDSTGYIHSGRGRCVFGVTLPSHFRLQRICVIFDSVNVRHSMSWIISKLFLIVYIVINVVVKGKL